ncbi:MULTISPECIES: TetR/AcrR family transcriptional regulator [Amycolatopsis]|uniref:TetR family transcriptional regulator n=1 Tax=Amycolatopsis thermoflava TaxID=84480 RepID=A0A3N2GU65_9PSEU|nr:TetR/AcrR family transcriptional regulator C-terminal domain-containing protein [Amycolatopsis thermoflava]ROS39800.1 TetR family transcriptional regulator [Amycolatopsis thermoflava]
MATRGRIDKRQAILDAAFTVFARQGYAQACVAEVAAEAGVAKPTVYNHFTEKANLFREAMTAEAAKAIAENLAAVDRLRDAGEDLRALLEQVGRRLIDCYTDDRSWAFRRLLQAELARFPELLDTVQTRAGTNVVTDALADRLARLALDGRLKITDPAQAAEQFGALLTAPLESRTRLGTRALPAAERDAVAAAAVDTFLRAYG